MLLAGAASNQISVWQGQPMQPGARTPGLREEELGTRTPGLREEGMGSRDGEPGWVGHSCVSPWPVVDFPDELHCVDLELLSNDLCAKAHPQKVTDLMLCAGHLEGGKDTCVVSQPVPLPQCSGSLPSLSF